MTIPFVSTNSLGIADIRILSTSLIHEQDVIIEVESTLTTLDCAQCGRTISEFDGFDAARTLRYLPPAGQPVYLTFRPKRFRCAYCDGHPITLQQINLTPTLDGAQPSVRENNPPAELAEQDLAARMVGQDEISGGRGPHVGPKRSE
jgi:transposase